MFIINIMKKTYQQPKLVVLGTVESLTQAFGSSTSQDTFTYSGFTGHATGSRDGVLVLEPKP